MAASARVNQKLYFARLTLEQAARAADATLQQALLEAAIVHLATAYRSYLNEIVSNQNLSVAADNARTALQQLQAQGRASPELSELVMLEQSGQWPARLLDTFATITAAAATLVSSAPISGAAIAIADITAVVDVELCRQWVDELQNLLDAQRQHLQEL
jgi:hypothetical protein